MEILLKGFQFISTSLHYFLDMQSHYCQERLIVLWSGDVL